ncbi:MAG: hypothetical protein HZC01_00695 [Candidatus Kerfeldbacteria bacterium]|nr:hypothetical protein [Candidatus Kerfeldbacteria bacterium]
MKDQRGFVYFVPVIAIVLVAIVMVGAAWYVEYNDTEDNDGGSQNITITNGPQSQDPYLADNANYVVDLEPVNIAPHDTTTTAAADGWQTITYQKADHGIAIDIPSDWDDGSSSMGVNDNDYLLWVNGIAQGESRVSGDVIYHKNASNDSLATWVSKYQETFADEYVFNEPKTIEGTEGEIIVLDVSQNTSDYTTVWAFIAGDERVYEFAFHGYAPDLALVSGTINTIWKSFRFIDPLPLITIPAETKTTAIAASQGYELEVIWRESPLELNLIDPVITSSGSLYTRRFYYDVGQITNGRYEGDALVVILEWPEGPAFYPNLYRVVFDETAKTFVYLEKYSDNLSYLGSKFTYDIGSTIPDLVTPEEIDIPNSDVDLVAEAFDTNEFYTDHAEAREAFKDDDLGSVFFDPADDCYLIVRDDGTVKLYHLKLDFIRDFTEREYSVGTNQSVPAITWSDGTTNDDEYTFSEPAGGCGSTSCHAMYTEEELGGISALKVMGTTSSGDKVYTFKDTDAQILKSAYDMYYAPYQEEKMDYDDFVADRPMFFWKDPLDHWVRFTRVTYLPAVECGKPVIYLYPQSTMEVNVQVDPNGGFSITDPLYPVGGWNVIAHPDGTLDYADGLTYPYLFWEGKGINYVTPEKGFVVARADVGSFLEEKLALLGLNEKESADFIKFWVPRMQQQPYYFVTFVDQAVFDTLAPLTVSPRPDSVIRVFMDYQGLDKPITVEPLEIRTPARDGFTVVEWGGALR